MRTYPIGNQTCNEGERVRIVGKNVGNRAGLEAVIVSLPTGSGTVAGHVPLEIQNEQYAGFVFWEKVENLQSI